jgi:hypothetical protein
MPYCIRNATNGPNEIFCDIAESRGLLLRRVSWLWKLLDVSVEISTEVETYDTRTAKRIVSVLGKTATVRRMGFANL